MCFRITVQCVHTDGAMNYWSTSTRGKQKKLWLYGERHCVVATSLEAKLANKGAPIHKYHKEMTGAVAEHEEWSNSSVLKPSARWGEASAPTAADIHISNIILPLT